MYLTCLADSEGVKQNDVIKEFRLESLNWFDFVTAHI